MTHGARWRAYQAWANMIRRRANRKHKGFKYWGGRGIRVCGRWLQSFENFYADMGDPPPGLTLDRWPDNDGNYEPGNCRWATWSQQRANQRRPSAEAIAATVAMFLHNDHDLSVIEFNSSSAVGISTPDHLQDMLNQADFAFLILTGEDEQTTGELNPRLNVVHEAGLFQGKLGFRKAILLLEEGCQDFSNVRGLTHIPFPKGKIETQFHEATRVLKREGLVR